MERKVEAFLDYLQKERDFSENTIEAYRSDLAQLVKFLKQEEGVSERSAKWSDVGRQTLKEYAFSLQSQGYASSTIGRKIAACKSLIKYLVADGVLDGIAASEMGTSSGVKARPYILNEDEMEQLIQETEKGITLEAKRDVAMIRLLYNSGMRVSEMTGLDVGDVSSNEKGKGYVSCRGSGGRERRISIEPEVIQSVEKYIKESRSQLLRDSGEQALFLNRLGRRLTRQGFWQILKGHARAAGVGDRVTPHTLRHSNAVHMLRQGMDVQTLQRRLGHTNMSTTQVYARLIPQDRSASGKKSETL